MLGAVSITASRTRAQAPPPFEPTACPNNINAERCGYVSVPETHANPDGARLRLAVAVYTATEGSDAGPLVMLEGGPGGSTVARFGAIIDSNGMDIIRSAHDIVLIEQRGTLFAEPFLNCEEVEQAAITARDSDLSPEALHRAERMAARACYDRWQAAGVNLGAFNSYEAAADIPLVMAALGYTGGFNVYGVSYGAVVAQHLMRNDPAQLRAVVLDAPVAPSINFVAASPANQVRAIQQLLQSCADNAPCAATFPALEAQFFGLITQLNDAPVTVEVQYPRGVAPVRVDGQRFAQMVAAALYRSELVPQVPQLIASAAEGNFLLVNIIAPQLSGNLAEGVYFSELCAAYGSYDPAEVGSGDSLFDLYASNRAALPEICAFWAVPRLPASAATAVSATIPTLILNGQFDPITPPSNGAAIDSRLRNSYNITFPTTAHGILPGPACPQSIMAAFLRTPTLAPNLACMDTMRLTFLTEPILGETLAGGVVQQPTYRVQLPLGWTMVERDFYASPDGNIALLVFDLGGSDPFIAIQAGTDLTLTDEPLIVLPLDVRWDIYLAETLQTPVFVALASPAQGRSYGMLFLTPLLPTDLTTVESLIRPILRTFKVLPETMPQQPAP